MIGEFILSDIAVTPRVNSERLRCCDRDGLARVDHPQCAAFAVPPGGLLTETYPKQRCMEFTRSNACGRCKLGPRQVINIVTSTFDLQTVYGTTTELANERRTFSGGQLEIQLASDGGELFAVDKLNGTGTIRFRCFKGNCRRSPFSDVRESLSPSAAGWALLFYRRHNQHGRGLAEVNSQWSDEQLYQEARRLTIAEYQHTIYDEYFPTLVGIRISSYFGFSPKNELEYIKYNPLLNIQSVLEFTTAAGRQGHGGIHEDIELVLSDQTKSKSRILLNLRDSQLYESVFYDGYVDALFRGQLLNPTFEITPSNPLKTFLFNFPNRTFGLDLGALDVQRGRDHGLPS